MTIDSLGAELGIFGGTFVVCFVGGLVPVVNAELWLVTVTLLSSSAAPLPLVVVMAAAGQMLAKSLLFVTARGAVSVPSRGRYRERVERARAAIARWRRRPALLLFASASVGIPPFYVTTLLAGGLGIRFKTFLAVGMLGRLARFGVVVALAWTGGS